MKIIDRRHCLKTSLLTGALKTERLAAAAAQSSPARSVGAVNRDRIVHACVD